MTKYVIGPDVAIRLAHDQAVIGAEHQILAPTLLRSQMLSLLYQAVHDGEMTKKDAERRLNYVRGEHLPGYLDEFCFRFNRRRSRSRGLVFYRVLQLAIGHDPVRYQQLIARSKPKTVRSGPPGNRGHPPSLDRPRARRPWRDAP
jgi:hypothetical protein